MYNKIDWEESVYSLNDNKVTVRRNKDTNEWILIFPPNLSGQINKFRSIYKDKYADMSFAEFISRMLSETDKKD